MNDKELTKLFDELVWGDQITFLFCWMLSLDKDRASMDFNHLAEHLKQRRQVSKD